MTTRPIMMVNGLDLDLGTTEALSVLVEANSPPALFLLGDTPVRIESHPDDGRPITRELTETRVVYHLAQAIEFRRATKGGTRPAWPPVTLARNILAAPSLPLPAIERIVEVPVLGRDGSVCATPGYHVGARVFYKPAAGFWVPSIPADPTDTEIEQARTLICDDLLGDFPFVGAAERAHAVALMALPFVRDLIDGPTPLHVIEKPMAGTGATLLADVLMRPALGRPLPAMTAGRDGDEWRKRLTAALTESPTAILWDNASRLDSDELAAALTAITWQDRPMGGSRLLRLPVRCCWIATANNPALNVEIVRRTVRIRLDAGTDRPWMRNGFRHPDLAGWTQAHRGDLVAAVLTLARAWIARDRPAGPPRHLGTYESWSKVRWHPAHGWNPRVPRERGDVLRDDGRRRAPRIARIGRRLVARSR